MSRPGKQSTGWAHPPEPSTRPQQNKTVNKPQAARPGQGSNKPSQNQQNKTSHNKTGFGQMGSKTQKRKTRDESEESSEEERPPSKRSRVEESESDEADVHKSNGRINVAKLLRDQFDSNRRPQNQSSSGDSLSLSEEDDGENEESDEEDSPGESDDEEQEMDYAEEESSNDNDNRKDSSIKDSKSDKSKLKIRKEESDSDDEEDEEEDDGEEEGDEGGEGEEMEEAIQEMAFGERQKVERLNDGFSNEHLSAAAKLELIRKEARRLQEKKKAEAKAKDAPAEMSSKIPVSRKRQVIHVQKRVIRDPRFDGLSGKFNEGMYKKAYSFIDDLKSNEMAQLRKEIAKEKNEEQKAKLTRALNIMEQRKLAEERNETKQKIKRDWRKQQEERVKQGKKPIFLKKSQIREKELEQKFQKLSSDGKIDKFLEKRRKKQASKDRRKLPFDARVTDE